MKELNKSTVLKNLYAVSFVISTMHKKNAGRLIKIKMVSLQHPDTIGIIKVTQSNQEKENLTLSENLTKNDLLDIIYLIYQLFQKNCASLKQQQEQPSFLKLQRCLAL